MNQVIPENDVLIECKDGLGVIILNRPRVLNALSLEMIRQISSQLRQWQDDKSVKAVLFMGAGDKAFSSGGDIKCFYHAGMDWRRGHATPKVPIVFFAEEYSMNRQIFHYKKPIISIMNGITMGGGYGIAGNCRYRVATDKTEFAMPEVRIGFFPDVGSLYHLSRSPDHIGRYLALSGNSMTGADMVPAGLAEHYLETAHIADFVKALGKATSANNTEGALDQVFKDFNTDQAPPSELAQHRESIAAAFAETDLRKILNVLKERGTDFDLKTAETLLERSPTSVMVVAHYLDCAADLDFDGVIGMDFILAQRFIKNTDMYEGIRAILIDKDRDPDWHPPSFEDIHPNYIEGYFLPTGYELKDVQIFN